MGSHRIDKDVVKKIFNQLSGKVDEEDELIPEMAIAGNGYIWCYEPTARQVVRIARGIKCFVLDATLDDLGRIMVYTIANDVILIEEDELIYTGFD
jgi:hypothetical protein